MKDDEEGVYDDAFQWSYEKRKSTFKMPGGGAKVADPELEKHLLQAVAECEEGNLQVLSELLIMEAVTFRPNWCGGAADPQFSVRAANFIYRFRQRHTKVWRATTTMGSKIMVGKFSKWRALSSYVYEKTKGISLKDFGVADETAMRKELVSRKQLASKGAKRVPAATSGDEKVCTTVFPLVTGDCVKLPLLIIDKGTVAPNRPDFRGKRNPKCIRSKVEAAVAAGRFSEPFYLWINKDGKMEEECMVYTYKNIWHNRPGNDPSNPTPSFNLTDAYASHRTDRVIQCMKSLQVCPGIRPGGELQNCRSMISILSSVTRKYMQL